MSTVLACRCTGEGHLSLGGSPKSPHDGTACERPGFTTNDPVTEGLQSLPGASVE